MTLDGINAEIAAARSGKEPVTNCDHMEAIMNKENHLVEYKRELSETFERSVVSFLNSTGGHIYIGING